MTAAEQKVMDELAERMDALELLVAQLTRKQGLKTNGSNGNGSRKPAGKPRWLDSAKYANACQGGCSGRVEQGQRCWYVPGVGVFHEACAPANASTP